jgi:putative heme-binding domain-containing protein
VELLHHQDQRVRLKAQFELVRRDERAALSTAAAATEPATHEGQLSRIHAIWGLGELLRSGQVEPAALTPFLSDADAEIRAQAAKVLGQARTAAVAPALVPLVSDASPRVQAFATIALGRMAYRPAMPAVVAMLAANDGQDVYLRNAGVVALTGFGDHAAIADLSTHQSRAVRLAAVVALRRLHDASVARFLDDADPLVVTEAARAINDEGGIVDAVPALARVLERPNVSGEPLVRRAISANLRVGDAAAVERVAAYARRPGVPGPLRVEAIETLGVWATPSNMDRADGAWIAPLPQRESSAAQAAVTELASLVSDPNATPAVRAAWIEAAAKLGLKGEGATILARLKSDSDSSVRVAALQALQTLAVPELEPGVRAAMADADNDVRSAAITALPDMSIAPAAKVELLTTVVRTAGTSEKQSAVRALGSIPGPAAVDALSHLADDLAAGHVEPAVQLDVLEAMRTSKAEPLLQRLDRLKVGRDLSKVATAMPGALLTGGSMIRGRTVALQHETAQCTRCHTLGDSKADVGPNLTHVASRLPHEQLLQSLIDPSARIAPGFGQVSLKLKNGRTLQGTLREETPTTIAVEDATGGLQRVPLSDVASRTNGMSAMPKMDLLLTPDQIRDVVAFLSTLQ